MAEGEGEGGRKKKWEDTKRKANELQTKRKGGEAKEAEDWTFILSGE